MARQWLWGAKPENNEGRVYQRLQFADGFTRPRETEDLIHAPLIVFGLRAPQPLAGAADLFCKTGFSSGQRVTLQRVHGERRRPDVTGLEGRPRQIVEPLAVPALDDRQMVDPGIGVFIRWQIFRRVTKKFVAFGVDRFGMEERLPVGL